MSEGDHRRRYVTLRWDRLPAPVVEPGAGHRNITFVCSHNSARSQFAAGLWTSRTGEPASSAGAEPAAAVHPTAVRVATEFGVDLSGTVEVSSDGLGEDAPFTGTLPPDTAVLLRP